VVPIVIGGIVAVAAVAAAAVFLLRNPVPTAEPQPVPVAVASEASKPEIDAAPKGEDNPAPADTTVLSDAIEPAQLAEADRAAPKDADRGATTTARAPEAAAPATSATAVAVAPDDKTDTKAATTARPPSKNPGDLSGAMANAVGADGTSKEDAPKASGPTVDPGSLPEKPSQGAIQSALGSVREKARSCVAGQTEPSQASITFVSSGAIKSIAISGGAEGTSAAACIRAAMMPARVGPFKQDTYRFTYTIRP